MSQYTEYEADRGNRVTAAELEIAITGCARARKPLLILGSPGIGKTELVEKVAREINYDIIPFELSICNPTMLMGLACYDRDTKRASFQPYDHLLQMITTEK
jgi:midasin (ATPase involved in ribosome maturation)